MRSLDIYTNTSPYYFNKKCMENSKENMHYYVRAKRVIPPVPVVLYERKELEPKVFNSSSELLNEISGVNDAFR